MKKKISIIGANSYIARNLIHVLMRDPESYEIALYDKAETQADGLANYTSVDLFSEASTDLIDFDCDLLFMFVGKTGSENGFDEFDLFIDINERALLWVLRAYRKHNSRAKIIFPSTRLVYKGRPGALREDAEKEFKTVYAINKFACEQYLEMYHRVYGISYCIFRICIPYGTLIAGASSYGTAEFMLKKATNAEDITLYGDGKIRRTLTDMGDLCEILIKASLSAACENDVFNIGGEDYSLLEMADLIARRYGVQVRFVSWPETALKIESGDTVFDAGKLENAIGAYTYHPFADWCQR
ncbi:MAG: NAD(P)-dependent oxidoreductase [Clostridiales Family XIII bacterium]|jgi:UDP-glucose 4-epimerase|nr:NAD(P)-dependent oxidoreductase [Clostridiales Family XIII bacterium]